MNIFSKAASKYCLVFGFIYLSINYQIKGAVNTKKVKLATSINNILDFFIVHFVLSFLYNNILKSTKPKDLNKFIIDILNKNKDIKKIIKEDIEKPFMLHMQRVKSFGSGSDLYSRSNNNYAILDAVLNEFQSNIVYVNQRMMYREPSSIKKDKLNLKRRGHAYSFHAQSNVYPLQGDSEECAIIQRKLTMCIDRLNLSRYQFFNEWKKYINQLQFQVEKASVHKTRGRKNYSFSDIFNQYIKEYIFLLSYMFVLYHINSAYVDTQLVTVNNQSFNFKDIISLASLYTKQFFLAMHISPPRYSQMFSFREQ